VPPAASHAIRKGKSENDTPAARASESAWAASNTSVRPAKVILPTTLADLRRNILPRRDVCHCRTFRLLLYPRVTVGRSHSFGAQNFRPSLAQIAVAGASSQPKLETAAKCRWARCDAATRRRGGFRGPGPGTQADGLHQRRNPALFPDAEIPKPLILRGLEATSSSELPSNGRRAPEALWEPRDFGHHRSYCNCGKACRHRRMGRRAHLRFSHTPQPSQSKHFMVAARTVYIDDARSHPASPVTAAQ